MQLQGVLAPGETHCISEGDTSIIWCFSPIVHLGAPARPSSLLFAGASVSLIIPHLRFCCSLEIVCLLDTSQGSRTRV